jgi:phenylpyruvate tautomerase PptA (4-oxalocrotonate tautomerase family)
MPYLRFYTPELTVEQKRDIARDITEAMLRALRLPLEARDWTIVHFFPFSPENYAVGGVLSSDSGVVDYHLEVSDRSLTQPMRERIVAEVTPTLVRLLGLKDDDRFKINIIFRSYSLDDLAIGGFFLRDIERQANG